MFAMQLIYRSLSTSACCVVLACGASAQVVLLPAPIGARTVCTIAGSLYISATHTDCTGLSAVSQLAIGTSGDDIIFDETAGATFNLPADFNDAVTTNSISNSGLITTGSVSSNTIFGNSATITNILSANGSFTDALTIVGSANVNMGGNIIHGVAAGVADTDAVNVAQLVAATSGVTTDITALETTTATHTTQIAGLETTTATHTTQIAAVEAVNTVQSGQISAIQAVNTTQSSQITAIQALNTTQAGQISALEAASASVAGDIDTLFDLRSLDRRDMKQGVASAMAMASAPMPSQPGRIAYAFNGAMFRGEYALGGSLTYRLPTRSPMAVNVGFSYAGNKNNGARVGVAGEF